MRLGDVGGYAVQNLKRRPLRTALTVTGVAVGIGALVLLVSLASGLEQIFSSQFDQAELITRVVVEREGKANSMRALLSGEEEKPEGPALTADAIHDFKTIPGVIAAYPEVMPILGLEARHQVTPIAGMGIPTEALEPTYPPALLAGSYWVEGSEDAQVCVLPSVLVRRLGYADPADAIGTKVAVTHYMALQRYAKKPIAQPEPEPGQPPSPTRYRYTRPDDVEVLELDVIGVYDSSRFGFLGRTLHLPLGAGLVAKKRFGFDRGVPEGEYQRAIVRVRSHEDVRQVTAAIEAKRYGTETVFDYLQVIEVVFAVFKLLLSFFGGVGVLVAFFGIANTMLMAVLERTREIGVLKALGARDRDVRRIFLIEAGSIGFFGGLVGLAGAWGIGRICNWAAGYVPALQESPALKTGFFLIPPWLAVGVLFLGALIAAGAGFYPAFRAARLPPVDALRRD